MFDLRETVLFKNTLHNLPLEYKEIRTNPGIRKQVSEIYFQKVYGSYQYSDYFKYMKDCMETLREKVTNPDLTIFHNDVIAYESGEQATEADRQKMLGDAEKMYINLTNSKNAEQNEKNAKEGLDYYRQIMSSR